MGSNQSNQKKLLLLLLLVVILLGSIYISFVSGIIPSNEAIDRFDKTKSNTNSSSSVESQFRESTTNPPAKTIQAKSNQEVTLKAGEEVQVGKDFKLLIAFITKPQSNPESLIVIGQAVSGTQSKYIGFSTGKIERLADQAFGYKISLKSLTEASVILIIKKI